MVFVGGETKNAAHGANNDIAGDDMTASVVSRMINVTILMSKAPNDEHGTENGYAEMTYLPIND